MKFVLQSCFGAQSLAFHRFALEELTILIQVDIRLTSSLEKKT